MPIYFNPHPANMPLTISSIGNRWDQESIHRPSGFPQYQWLHTERGAGDVTIGQHRFALPKGTGMITAPNTPHSYHATGDEWLTAFVTFTGDLAGEIGKVIGPSPYAVIQPDDSLVFQTWIDTMVSLHQQQRLDPFRLSAQCYAFLLEIRRLQYTRLDFSSPLYDKYIVPVLQYIETHFEQEITARQLAQCVYISPQYLMRLFNQFLGCSPHQYVINTRINKAKELLVSRPDMKIQQLSMRVGYKDVSHFIAAFKRTAGYTPLVFRRMQRQ